MVTTFTTTIDTERYIISTHSVC